MSILKRLKSHETLKRIPVFIFTTSEAQEHVESACAYGASAYISKPHSVDEYAKLARAFVGFWSDVARRPNPSLNCLAGNSPAARYCAELLIVGRPQHRQGDALDGLRGQFVLGQKGFDAGAKGYAPNVGFVEASDKDAGRVLRLAQIMDEVDRSLASHPIVDVENVELLFFQNGGGIRNRAACRQ